MSWMERVEVTLRPMSLTMRRVRPWASHGAPTVVPLAARSTEATEAWRDPLQALAHALDNRRDAGAALHLVLSDHFARFAVVTRRPSGITAFSASTFSRIVP